MEEWGTSELEDREIRSHRVERLPWWYELLGIVGIIVGSLAAVAVGLVVLDAIT